jgi:hemoglobin
MHERTQAVYTPPGGPPPGSPLPREILVAMGEPGIFALLEAFYGKLFTSEVKHLFPSDSEAMTAASQKSAAFFIQILGGRPLFSQHFGPPRMRMRHIPFEIDAPARAVWLKLFHETVEEAVQAGTFPPEHLASFQAFLNSFSTWMVNVAPVEKG